ncbi:cupin domain-containing protein [Verticiella sediminum]|uniref:Cupin domain-containing protein n=1 Tax=Verticiella sediminum TaxID=1247510 RepID=A0A556APZ7_9BURK|nr:cupin domain-containing protein [Verticiella sediminum]TSH94971.1 cupin domain-containing protein [Verticiella sediminum]
MHSNDSRQSTIDDSDGPSTAQQGSIGARLRAHRKQKRLSIYQLSELSGVSVGMISQIERDKTNPSLKLLENLRAALGLTLSELLEEYTPVFSGSQAPSGPSEPLGFVRRRQDRPRFLVGKIPLEKELLSPGGAEGIEMIIIHFPPHSSNQDVIIMAGQKAGVVLEGTLRLVVNGVTALLEPGDSFQFDSSIPHSVHNDSAESMRVLWIISPFKPALF